MKLGKKVLEALQAEIDGQLNPGDELIVAGPVAAEGTAWITENNYERLREVFAERFLEDARRLPEVYGTGMKEENNKVWEMAAKAGASARYLMGEGGFLGALWKMAEASGVGLEVDLRSVPIRRRCFCAGAEKRRNHGRCDRTDEFRKCPASLQWRKCQISGTAGK